MKKGLILALFVPFIFSAICIAQINYPFMDKEGNRDIQAYWYNIPHDSLTLDTGNKLDFHSFLHIYGHSPVQNFKVKAEVFLRNRKKVFELSEEALSWYLEKYKIKRKPSTGELFKAKETLKKMLENVLSAPIYVAVLVDSKAKHPDYILYDGTLATGYLMIAARALGYGTGFFTTFFPEEDRKDSSFRALSRPL